MENTMILTPVPIADLMAQIRGLVRDELQQQQRNDLAEKLMTPQETADLLRVSLVTIYSWVKDGRLTKHSMGGRTYFKYSELMASLDTLQRYKKHHVGRPVS
jgi:excisionase family DNA binding protein